MGTEEESLTGCLITSSYDGFLRVWRDLDSTQVAVAQSGNLSRNGRDPFFQEVFLDARFLGQQTSFLNKMWYFDFRCLQ